jgi:predicted nucleic acid-binding protein
VKGSREVVVDTGPLVALTNKLDDHHQPCCKVLKLLSAHTRFYTCGSVLAEVFHILPPTIQARKAIFSVMEIMPLIIDPIECTHFNRIKEILFKYDNLSLDFADASLFALAEKLSADTIFTIDKRDFSLLRPKHVRAFHLLPN